MLMRHFLQGEALAVLALPDGVDLPPAEGRLVFAPGAPQALLMGSIGAGPRAIAAPAVAGPAQMKLCPAPRTSAKPQLLQDAPMTRTDVDNAGETVRDRR
jgi:hypothetical protein